MTGEQFASSKTGVIYEVKMTRFVFIACIIGAMGGLIFGYDIGIQGGVTSMDVFLQTFFPSVYHQAQTTLGQGNNYCSFNSQLITLFTSALYPAALLASLIASSVTKTYGRKVSMCLGGGIFLGGSILNGAAQNVIMLVFGRVFLGIGIGFASQAVPVYLSEMAPAAYRGALNIGFQLATTIGMFLATMLNYGTNKLKSNYGWRISLGTAAAPAVLMTVGAFFLPDTPNSLVERGRNEEAKTTLIKIRGVVDVEEEYDDILSARIAVEQIKNPWRSLLERKYRPQLVICILIPMFQQLTGMEVIMYYAPVLFRSLGYQNQASLVSTVITGGINVVATLFSIACVDRCGRRLLMFVGGVQMLLSQVVLAVLLALEFGTTGRGSFSDALANVFIIFIGVFVAGYAWSWGPLGWLIPSEICPLEIRCAGQSLTVCVNMLFTFIIAECFLPMLCHMKFGLFIFFAFFQLIMTLFIYFFVPETKNVPIEDICQLWETHWFWGKYVIDGLPVELSPTNRFDLERSF